MMEKTKFLFQYRRLLLPVLLTALLLLQGHQPAQAQLAQLSFTYMGVDESASLVLIVNSLIGFLWKFNAATIPIYFFCISSRLLYRVFY